MAKKYSSPVGYYSFIIALILAACVEPINFSFNTSKSVLVIDGSIDDQRSEQYISIKKSVPQATSAFFAAEEGAEVVVLENQKIEHKCSYRAAGDYYLPAGFKTEVGSNYQLIIKLKDGNTYKSSIESMRFTPEISKLYYKYDPEGNDNNVTRTPSYKIYIDTKDNEQSGDNYIWSYTYYENQYYCKTCDGGLFYTTPLPAGRCLANRALTEQNISYDYLCNGNCWEIINSLDINVMGDTYINGNQIIGRQIGNIPVNANSGFLIEVIQQNLGASSYRYLKLLADQSQNNGTLVDSPPAPLVGNIKNVSNEFENVGGFFFVGSAKKKTLFITREEAKSYFAPGLLGRPVVLEPTSDDLSRPPYAPCIKSNTRTPIRPTGWPIN